MHDERDLDSATALKAIPLHSLPALKQPFEGGTFCGVITLPDGTHAAIVLLNDRPETAKMPWKQATAWAKRANGQLPPPAVAALLFTIAPTLFRREDYWTDRAFDSMYSECVSFADGSHGKVGATGDLGAVAVRLIPLAQPADEFELERRIGKLEQWLEVGQLKKRVAILEDLIAKHAAE
ncbi:MAG TPA: hypothetical protein VFR90_01485 [Methylibium sp.]|uniref:hypothetical protein n=1 Tax=Methylibium sp. TaxID=2067992 RepID=UPI002DB59ED4|nr:hypothetical protein [Methylibium sp.]HEU4457778.1 hypothetical protein [Methylibium sp.]